MHYQEVLELKQELADLKLRLAELKGLEPNEDRAREILEIEDRAKGITRYIKARAKQYGFVA